MKILLVHPNPLEDYHLERLVYENLTSLNHEVITLKYRGFSEEELLNNLRSESEKVDFTLILKGELLKESHYEAIQSYSGLWYVDHPKESILPDWLILGCSKVDWVFATSFGLIESLKKYNSNVFWIVEGAHLPFLQPQESEKKKDISFFGTLMAETNNGDVFGQRIDFLKAIAEKYDFHLYGIDSSIKIENFQFANTYPAVWNQELAKEISETKIIIGYNSLNSIPLYWSNRTYVTLACKGFLVTPYVPGLECVFENHKDLVWFSSKEELYEILDYYLDNEFQRNKIAQQGYNKVKAFFSTQSQIQKILAIVAERFSTLGKRRKVLFVIDSGYVGCITSAKHWAALLQSRGIRADLNIVEDFISKEFCNQYQVVIVGGYSSKYKEVFESSAKRCLIWQSSIFQTQLEGEVRAIRKIKQLETEKKIDQILVADLSASKLFTNAIWIPNFCFFESQASEKKIVDDSKINLCALSPSKDRKNLFTILAAFQYLNDQHILHINVSKEYFENNIQGIFNTERIINHEWMEKEDYCALIKQCLVGFQISVAESYNYVAAEHLLLGTPIICSASIPAIAIRELTIKNHENAGEILEKIDIVKRATAEQKTSWCNSFREADLLRVEKASQQLLYRVLEVPEKRAESKNNRPILSIIYHGRSDNYGGDYKRRLAWSLSSIRKAFSSLQPEIIFVNWNTLLHTPPLFEDPLFYKCSSGIKVYEIPNALHEDLLKKHKATGTYLEWYAKNFGIRRASGEYILQINSDNLILDNLSIEDLPPKHVTYIGSRTEIDADILTIIPAQITQELLNEKIRRVLNTDIERPHYVGGSCGEFILTHRDNWEKICGNPETADRYCIDNVTATHLRMISDLRIFPHSIYHISHISAEGTWPGFDFPLGYSGPKWGLVDYQIQPRIWR